MVKYKKIYEKGEFFYFIRTSNKNKYYYKAKRTENNEILNLDKISSSEFWDNFQEKKIEENIEEKPVLKPEYQEFEEDEEPEQEIQENKSFLDLKL